jgi:hypothetical protein
MLKETIDTRFTPQAMRGNFFQNTNHFSLKSKLKVSQEQLGNQEKGIFNDLRVFKGLDTIIQRNQKLRKPMITWRNP